MADLFARLGARAVGAGGPALAPLLPHRFDVDDDAHPAQPPAWPEPVEPAAGGRMEAARPVLVTVAEQAPGPDVATPVAAAEPAAAPATARIEVRETVEVRQRVAAPPEPGTPAATRPEPPYRSESPYGPEPPYRSELRDRPLDGAVSSERPAERTGAARPVPRAPGRAASVLRPAPDRPATWSTMDRAHTAAPPPTEQTVRISIGRIEVRAVAPAAPAPGQPEPARAQEAPRGPGLVAYLRGERGWSR